MPEQSVGLKEHSKRQGDATSWGWEHKELCFWHLIDTNKSISPSAAHLIILNRKAHWGLIFWNQGFYLLFHYLKVLLLQKLYSEDFQRPLRLIQFFHFSFCSTGSSGTRVCVQWTHTYTLCGALLPLFHATKHLFIQNLLYITHAHISATGKLQNHCNLKTKYSHTDTQYIIASLLHWNIKVYIYHYPGEKGQSQRKQLVASVVAVFLLSYERKKSKKERVKKQEGHSDGLP